MRRVISFLLLSFIIQAHSTLGQDIPTDWRTLEKTTSLSSYIRNHAYEYLNFELQPYDAKFIDRSPIVSPLIVINKAVQNDWKIIDLVRLKDVNEINVHKPDETVMAIYGSSGKYGLIGIDMNSRKVRRLKRKIRQETKHRS